MKQNNNDRDIKLFSQRKLYYWLILADKQLKSEFTIYTHPLKNGQRFWVGPPTHLHGLLKWPLHKLKNKESQRHLKVWNLPVLLLQIKFQPDYQEHLLLRGHWTLFYKMHEVYYNMNLTGTDIAYLCSLNHTTPFIRPNGCDQTPRLVFLPPQNSPLYCLPKGNHYRLSGAVLKVEEQFF